MSRARKKWRSKLLAAVEKDDLDAFTKILSEVCGTLRTYNEPFWQVCLVTASKREGGHVFVRALLGVGVRPRWTSVHTEPFHFACQGGHDETLRALLEDRRTDVNSADSRGRTALHHLAVSFDDTRPGYLRCLHLLLSHPELDVDRPNYRGYTALHEAANRGASAFVAKLLASRPHLDVDEHLADGRTARDAVLERLPSLAHLLPPVRRDIPDAQERLLRLLRKRKLKDFIGLLYLVDDYFHPVVNPDHWYEEHRTTCLQEASKRQVSPEFARYLLRSGADPNIANPLDGSMALHYAAEKANLPVLRLLVHCERTDVNAANFQGETALHVVVKLHGGTDKCEECLRALLQHPILDVDKPDKMGETALSLASVKHDESSVRFLLPYSTSLYPFCESINQNVDDIAIEKMPHSNMITENLMSKAVNVHTVKEILVEYLKENDIQNFLKLYKRHVKSDKDILDLKIGEETILQYACRFGMADVVNALLKYGADPNKIDYNSRLPPIILAVVNHKHDVLSLLLKLRRKIGLSINITDEHGNTSLYYASLNKDINAVKELLRHGANMSLRNIYGKLALESHILEKVLDSSITSTDHNQHDTEFRLNFDFTTLVNDANEDVFPGISEDEVWLRIDSGVGPDEINKHTKRKETEMEFFSCISECDEYQDVLLHPVVKLFLDLKWKRLKLIFVVRLVLYTVFVFLLNTYILMCDLNKSPDSGTGIRTVKEERNLSTPGHEELQKEWSKPKTVFMSVLFLVLFLATMVDTAITMYKIPLRLIRPCRLSVSPGTTRRVLRFSRVLDLSVNIFTSVFLYKIKAESIQEVSAVIIILCSWTKLMLLLANFRKPFSNLKIIESILDRYVPSLLPYYLVVIGFAFSFHILLRDEDYFHNPWTSLFKTTIMMTGDIGLKSQMFNLNPGVSHIVFVLFIVLIVIVAINILSIFLDDAQEVRKNAQILHIQDKVEILSEIETFLVRLREIKLVGRCLNCSRKAKFWFQNIFIFAPHSNKIISVFPNKSKLVHFSDRSLPGDIDNSIITSSMALVKNIHNSHCSSEINCIKDILKNHSQMLSELKDCHN